MQTNTQQEQNDLIKRKVIAFLNNVMYEIQEGAEVLDVNIENEMVDVDYNLNNISFNSGMFTGKQTIIIEWLPKRLQRPENRKDINGIKNINRKYDLEQ